VTSTAPAGDVVGRAPSADDRLVRAYTERTPGSAASFAAARRVLPGGETRAVTTYPPYPVIIAEGHGGRLTDVDGHIYLDLVNNYTAMVHGSAFPPATEAVAELLPQGFAFASPHPYQIALAELLAARMASLRRVRFTNSGTEAALLAARIAARATGRRRLLMFDGAYHGSATLFLPGSPDMVRVPWNDPDAVAVLLGRPDHDIAAVFAEPFLGAGGVRPAAPGFLAAVAGLARDHDVLFVLDEVQGLRNGFGGEQGRLGLTPDGATPAGRCGGGAWSGRGEGAWARRGPRRNYTMRLVRPLTNLVVTEQCGQGRAAARWRGQWGLRISGVNCLPAIVLVVVVNLSKSRFEQLCQEQAG
jgi:glutamate-1-semialdehyde 2,1-aminomutase